MGTCANCRQQRGRLIAGRCNTCYRYRRRTGRDRDIDRIVATNAARLERDLAVPWVVQIEYQRAWRLAGDLTPA